VADEAPEVGFDWLAGQGGYGIMMAPALAQFAKDLLMGGSTDLRKGISFESESLSPQSLKVNKQ
jgi:D-arginine dehydrogenase